MDCILYCVLREGASEEITLEEALSDQDKRPDWRAQEWREAAVVGPSEQRDGAVGGEGRQGLDHVRRCRPRQGSWVFYKTSNGAWGLARKCFLGESLDWMNSFNPGGTSENHLEIQSWYAMV